MKSLSENLVRRRPCGWLGAGRAFRPGASGAQQPAPLKPASPGAIAAAKELLTMKNVSAIYAGAVPNIVQRAKDQLLAEQSELPKRPERGRGHRRPEAAGREKEIGEQMAKIYANDFTEQELKDLVTFYKTPLGQKLLAQEPKTVQASMAYMQQWAQNFSETVIG